MPFSCSWSKTKRRLGDKQHNFYAKCFVAFGYILSVTLGFVGLLELYYVKTSVTRQCRVNTVDLNYLDGRLYIRWNITTLHDNNETKDDSILESPDWRSESGAWTKLNQYKINETYPCYHSKNQTSIFSWRLRWEKVSKPIVYLTFIGSLTVFLLCTVLILLIQYYQKKFPTSQEQYELNLRLEPSREEQIQWFGRT